MQDREKKKLKRQLEQEADNLLKLDGNDLVISLISTCNALLKASSSSLEEKNVPDEVYAVYMSIAESVKGFYDSYSNINEDNSNDAEMFRALIEEVQAKQSKSDELTEQISLVKKSNDELKKLVDKNKKSLQEQKDIRDSLNKMLQDCTAEMIDEQKKKNDEVLESLNQQKKKLSDLADQKTQLLDDKLKTENAINEIEMSIKEIPEEHAVLRNKYKELESLLKELKEAEVEYSPDKQAELQKEIIDLTPIVEENKVATEVLLNQKDSLSKQNTKYDCEKKILTTDLIEIITESLEQLKCILKDQSEFLDNTEMTAKTLAENVAKCQKKRDDYKHWLDVVETPLEAMITRLGLPESGELRKTLNINQVQTVKNSMEEIRRNLIKLDNILAVCASATQKDLQIVKRRAGQ